jgi:tRNA U34 5-methylaminomethyl-2-thiouridine-forming methyltransferase MnmC
MTQINDACLLEIAPEKLLNFKSKQLFDVIYFDAFAAVHQPEMWNSESLNQISKFVKPGGVFVSYAITGELKRTMKSLGFSIEKAPGAAGKREMLRAVKL